VRSRSPDQEAAEVVLARFLDTHALVSLDDVLERYPFERSWAESRLRAWADSGRVVPVQPVGEAETMQWSAPGNLEQVQRGSLGLLRREVLTCPAPQFADFLLRWQGVHPDTRKGTSEGLAETLARLQGFPLTADLWEQTVLPARVPEYQPRWLDEWVAGGAGVWVAQGDLSGSGLLAFLGRDELLELSPPATEETPLSGDAQRVLDNLRQRGASFVSDLAQATGRSPSSVRAGLWELTARTLVTNDHFDVVRRADCGSRVGRRAS